MAIEWTASADKHGIPHADALHAILHAEATDTIESRDGQTITVYVGRPHPHTDRYLEVLTVNRPPRTVVVFHVMHLTDLFRHLLNERPTP